MIVRLLMLGWSDPSSEVTATPAAPAEPPGESELTATLEQQDPSAAPPSDLSGKLVAGGRRAQPS